MAQAKKKTAKGASFSKTSKAATVAYNAKNKVRIAKEELGKTKTAIRESKKSELAYANPIIVNKSKAKETYKVADKMVNRQKGITKELEAKKGKISQSISERSRTATRAAGIAKRVAKKSK